MVEAVALRFAIPVLALAVLLVAVRALRGPTLADRVVALDVLSTIGVALAGAWAIGTGQSAFLDAALVLGVLHHLPDDIAAAAMRELARVLKPGATALVIEDIPPPDGANLPGHLMHWLDRGGYIRDEAAYRALFGAQFSVERTYPMRSGICDYSVYVLHRTEL